ncbi:MAG: radical SAM protein [Ruminococcus sp.]|nr:radical SAM protein [Ruminococcus sp.]
MAHSNISIFVPHAGCPHKCSFCDQNSISGAMFQPDGEYVRKVCSEALECSRSPEETEIAFFGGSFTAIRREYMLELLEAAREFVGEGKFKGIRISTRPDHIDKDILRLLREYGVTAIELGAQSLDDRVLAMNERGHTREDVINASRLIQKNHFELGLQMMVGLYGSSRTAEWDTINIICALKPDTVRIYPVVILNNTRLGELFLSGVYKPFDFDEAVEITSHAMLRFESEGIRVIKVGLHASQLVEQDMLGGFYHPAFRELCEAVIYRKLIEAELAKHKDIVSAQFSVPGRELSKALGQKKSNIRFFEDRGIHLHISPDSSQKEKLKLISCEKRK